LRSGYRLVERMMAGRSQVRTVEDLVTRVVVEPILARLVAADDRVPGRDRVVTRVLRGRGVAAPDVPAAGAAPEVEPPAIRCEAFRAAGTARRYLRIDDLFVRHRLLGYLHRDQGEAEWRREEAGHRQR